MHNQPQPSIMHRFDDENVLGELNVDIGCITVEETLTAIRCLKNRKAPCLNEIAAEKLKAGDMPITEQLTTLYNSCWHQRNVPEDWKKA
ncbi:unnamed protein product [Heligmosomoides polygyrus]|uniref:Aldo_ket_red domain-containing protein n=1 Tax=Heligmosomoides polygyrus TaxID=6339 RepID=A0A183GPS3_HELPZ|nr:unnamed protein product [Heligmosomoides polygyrus]